MSTRLPKHLHDALALRNRIIHGYDRLEHAIVFDTVRRDLAPLIEKLSLELQRHPLDG